MSVYLFDEEQLLSLLENTVDMFVEFRDKHAHTEELAKFAASLEMITGLDNERQLAAEDPKNYRVTSQIFPIPATIEPDTAA